MKASRLVEVGECFPEIKLLKEIKYFFVTIHGSRLNFKIKTGHIDQFVLFNLNGFPPFKARASLILQTLDPKLLNTMSF